ncbi:MAG: EamA family transporter [Lachnospiraceae bacterium]|jgi:drug/metabolite transporter (DMT)-like permease|nr:EamA family transporter [Lachnospiraceae bacterium]
MSVFIMIAAAFVTALSQILLKKSAMKEHGGLLSQYLNLQVFLGYLLMMTALLMNIWAYRTVEYHLGPLLNASSYIFVLVLGKLVLKEQVSRKALLGNLLILIGILIAMT